MEEGMKTTGAMDDTDFEAQAEMHLLAARAQETFTLIDIDESGSLTLDEIRKALASMGLNSGKHMASIEMMLMKADLDGSGEIEVEELLAFIDRGPSMFHKATRPLFERAADAPPRPASPPAQGGQT